jgi:hypothetical protein
MKKKNNNSVLTDYNIKNNYNNYTNNTYIHPNLDSIEIDELISNVFPQKEIDGNNYIKRINKNKTDRRFYYTESDLNFMPIKANTENTSINNNKNSLSQYNKYINKKEENVIINKMAELKEKIKSKIDCKNTPSTTRRTYQLYTHKTIYKQKNKKKSETLDNKHIKKNIPSYRRSYSRSNNINVGNKNIINNKINSINNIDKNKINNTIFINNSNITISNNRTNNLSQDNLKEIKEKNIELNDLLTNVLNPNTENKIESINKQYRIQSNLDLDLLKSNNPEYFSQTNDEIIDFDDKNEKIINKLATIKMKINKEKAPPKRKTYPVFRSKRIKKFNTMNNKQIKNNIPSYRKGHSQSNNFYPSVLNSFTFDNKKKKEIIRRLNLISTDNSFNNRSLGSSNLKSKKMNINRYTIYNKTGISHKKYNEKNVRNINSSMKSLLQSYLNESSLSNAQNNKLNLKNCKAKKNQRLYNFISKNIININSNNQNNRKEDGQKKIKSQNGEVIIIDLSPINLNESLINKDLLKDNINNKIVLDYNKLEGLNTSKIIYDGFVYKVVESKENGYKLIERYFQLLKNCFRYYNNLENAVNNMDKPLVQFDIRHIKEISIINTNNDVFKKYKIKEKQIEFVFCVFLYQNDDFFVFASNNKEFGNTIFDLINLLKNYYAKK